MSVRSPRPRRTPLVGRRRIFQLGPLAFAAWGLGVALFTVGVFAVDHASPLSWSGPALLLTLGRSAGVVAGLQLLLHLVLAARPRALERRYGADGLLRAHALNGVLLVGTVGLHAGLLVLAGATLSAAGAWSYAWQLVENNTPVLLAAAGLGVLGVVWGSSAVRALRARHRDLWHALHLLGYLAVALVVPHQVLTGSDFLAHPWLAVVWLATWSSVLLLAVGERVVRPAWFARRHPLTVVAVTPEAPGTTSLILRSPAALPGLEPGGVVLLGVDRWRRHPFSVSQRLDESTLRCTIEAVGDFTQRLASLTPGDRLTLTGVHGRFTARNATTDGPYLLVAAGLGMTGVRGLLDGLLEQGPGVDIVVLYRVRDGGHVLYAGELAAACRRGVDIRVLAGSRGDPRVRACAPEDLVALVPDAAAREWFVCGPEGYMSVVRRAARSLGVPAARLHAERFTLGR